MVTMPVYIITKCCPKRPIRYNANLVIVDGTDNKENRTRIFRIRLIFADFMGFIRSYPPNQLNPRSIFLSLAIFI